MTNKFMRRIRVLSIDELDTLESEMRAELSSTRAITELGGSIRNSAKPRNLKRNIARILTVRNERRGV